ncbi:MAG: MBL fold metallo-hydrolase, partial [Pseudohongiellaceae bacterium]
MNNIHTKTSLTSPLKHSLVGFGIASKRFWQLSLTVCLTLLVACEASTVDVTDASLGTPSTEAAMVSTLANPGPIVFTKHIAAHWAVPLSGLLNLDHPLSQAAGIEDREESIDIYVYSLVHPEYGTFIVDSGVAESFADSSKNNEASWIVESFMNMSALDVVKSTKELKQELGSIDGVLLTHIHTDHIMGLPDLSNTRVYGGPNDAELSAFTHAFTQGTTDRLLRNVNVLEQWQFSDTGIIDIFGDGSLWAIHTPGHTPGATAYL